MLAADPLGTGDHARTLMVGELERNYIADELGFIAVYPPYLPTALRHLIETE